MEHDMAMTIAEWLADELRPFCEPERVVVAGSLRRGKPEVGDIEIVAAPILKAPRPEFGRKEVDKTLLDRQLREMCDPLLGACLRRGKGGDRFKKFAFTRWEEFGFEEPVNPFYLDLFLVTPPAQWGVQLTIRTGPGAPDNNFSQWVVTQRAKGGALPDGYCVKDGGVWEMDFGGTRMGGAPLSMPEERDFLEFLGLGWIEPRHRKPMWRTR